MLRGLIFEYSKTLVFLHDTVENLAGSFMGTLSGNDLEL